MVEFNILGIGILSWMIFLPVLGMLVIIFIPKAYENSIKYFSLIFTFLLIVLSVILLLNYNSSMPGVNMPDSFQFREKVSWIDVPIPAVVGEGKIHIDYFLGLD